jgi:hypothetical protein
MLNFVCFAHIHEVFIHLFQITTIVSFDKLSLPASMLVSLYSNSLVDFGDTQPVATKPENTVKNNAYAFFGGNEKKVVLVITGIANSDTTVAPVQFLQKMMQACKMSLPDFAVVNHSHQQVNIDQLKTQLQPTTVLLFGPGSLEIGLPVNFPTFKQQSYDGTHYLCVPDLELLTKENDEGKLLKSKLWVCLRQLFGI